MLVYHKKRRSHSNNIDGRFTRLRPQVYSSASIFNSNFNLNAILKPEFYNSTLNHEPQALLEFLPSQPIPLLHRRMLPKSMWLEQHPMRAKQCGTAFARLLRMRPADPNS